MKIFIDTAEVEQIKLLVPTGLIDGVTTNPSLIAKSGRKIGEAIVEMCALIPGPISAEAVASDYDTLLAEGRFLAKIAPNVVVKLPLTPVGLRVCKTLSDEGTPVNVTLCFSAVQALLAAKSGATYISPFIGRLDDNGSDGMELIRDIRLIYDNYGFETQILAASARTALHVRDAALAGADCATLPPAVFNALYKHVLTDLGLDAFMKDWITTGQSIL
ncbi:fructose-6-phosphate aldolase [Candidatus Phycosocius spiralis]|uniref:Probable transaldolase n=1 Tax=Candidatus Phycosocius spiralis TaxID=2815099 RepID=A0ABQ4PUU4_9PROT|nr:fructose-6-phosphate aldolase [Candidatus Phycosocius spiralis]GIU66791.1 putative transaldolase [Candidatus Phycosocius spiralis]